MSIFNLEANNLDLTLICKYFIKVFLTWKSKLAYLKYQLGQISINSEHFYLGTNLGPAGGKYLIKIIFDIKIKISILKYQMCQISINFEHF